MTFTLETRNEYRRKMLERYGADWSISESAADEIRAIIAEAYVITGETYNGATLIVEISPRLDRTARQRIDVEARLSSRFGNDPYRYSTEFTMYRFTFAAN